MPNQRKRARRSGAGRTSAREGRSGVFGKMLVTLSVVAAIVLCVAIFFRVQRVEVKGNRIYSADQVLDVSGVESGDNLLTVNKPAVAGNIYARLPYVQTVSVYRKLPDTIVIQIQESEIAGLVKSDTGSSWYINTSGRVLGSSVEVFDGQVVELNGFTITAPNVGEDAMATQGQEDNLRVALSALSGLEGTGLIQMVTSIEAEKSFDVVVVCGDRYEVQVGGEDQMEYKLWCLQSVMEELDEYETGIIDVTLSSGQKVRFIPWE